MRRFGSNDHGLRVVVLLRLGHVGTRVGLEVGDLDVDHEIRRGPEVRPAKLHHVTLRCGTVACRDGLGTRRAGVDVGRELADERRIRRGREGVAVLDGQLPVRLFGRQPLGVFDLHDGGGAARDSGQVAAQPPVTGPLQHRRHGAELHLLALGQRDLRLRHAVAAPPGEARDDGARRQRNAVVAVDGARTTVEVDRAEHGVGHFAVDGSRHVVSANGERRAGISRGRSRDAPPELTHRTARRSVHAPRGSEPTGPVVEGLCRCHFHGGRGERGALAGVHLVLLAARGDDDLFVGGVQVCRRAVEVHAAVGAAEDRLRLQDGQLRAGVLGSHYEGAAPGQGQTLLRDSDLRVAVQNGGGPVVEPKPCATVGVGDHGGADGQPA